PEPAHVVLVVRPDAVAPVPGVLAQQRERQGRRGGGPGRAGQGLTQLLGQSGRAASRLQPRHGEGLPRTVEGLREGGRQPRAARRTGAGAVLVLEVDGEAPRLTQRRRARHRWLPSLTRTAAPAARTARR